MDNLLQFPIQEKRLEKQLREFIGRVPWDSEDQRKYIEASVLPFMVSLVMRHKRETVSPERAAGRFILRVMAELCKLHIGLFNGMEPAPRADNSRQAFDIVKPGVKT
jgi:hypothetical protein